MSPVERYLSTGEVARLFRRNPETIRRWATEGLIPSHETPSGRLQFRESDLRPALERAGLIADAERAAQDSADAGAGAA